MKWTVQCGAGHAVAAGDVVRDQVSCGLWPRQAEVTAGTVAQL